MQLRGRRFLIRFGGYGEESLPEALAYYSERLAQSSNATGPNTRESASRNFPHDRLRVPLLVELATGSIASPVLSDADKALLSMICIRNYSSALNLLCLYDRSEHSCSVAIVFPGILLTAHTIRSALLRSAREEGLYFVVGGRASPHQPSSTLLALRFSTSADTANAHSDADAVAVACAPPLARTPSSSTATASESTQPDKTVRVRSPAALSSLSVRRVEQTGARTPLPRYRHAAALVRLQGMYSSVSYY